MSVIITRAGKGIPLTNEEGDANFTNLNLDKPDIYSGVDDPTVNHDSADTALEGRTFKVGDQWLSSDGHWYLCTNASVGAAQWSSADVIDLAHIPSSPSHSIQDMQNMGHSAGIVNVDSGDFSAIATHTGLSLIVTIQNFETYIRETNSAISNMPFFRYTANESFNAPANSQSYIILEYNAGSPQIVNTTGTLPTVDTSNGHDRILIAEVYAEATKIHEIVHISDRFNNHSYLMTQRQWEVGGVTRASGSIVSQGSVKSGTGETLTVAVTEGIWWLKFLRSVTNAGGFDSGVAGTLVLYYRDNTPTWTEVTGQIDLIGNQTNLSYNNTALGTLVALSSISGGRFGNMWIYLGVTDGDIRVVYGTSEYLTQAAAEAASAPTTLPAQLNTIQYTLAAQVVVQRDNPNFVSVRSPFVEASSLNASTLHNDLAGLDGGSTTERYHLTAAEFTVATQAASATVNGFVTTGAQTFEGIKTFNQIPVLPANTINTTELVDGAVTASKLNAALNALIYKGATDPTVVYSAPTIGLPAANAGEYYISSTAGTIYGDTRVIQQYDSLVCNTDGALVNEFAKWDIIQGNLDIATEVDLGGATPSNTKVPSQAAVKTYIDTKAIAMAIALG